MADCFIRKLTEFCALNDDDIAALGQAIQHPTIFKPRQDLIREGDQSGPLFVMMKGWAFRYKILSSGSRQIIALLMPGDFCDLHVGMAEMDHSIQTATHATIASVPREVMADLLERHAGIARAMYVAQLVEQATLRAWIVSLGRRNSAERAAHLLLELYLRGVRVGLAKDGRMDLPLSQAVLADALGMTPVHINRVLQELRRAGAVELQRGVLRISSPAALIQFSGYDEKDFRKQLHKKVLPANPP